MVYVRYQAASPPPTKRIKHERPLMDGSGRGVGRSLRVKPEAALGSARHHDGRTSTPRSVIVISDTEDDNDAASTLSVLSLVTVLTVLPRSVIVISDTEDDNDAASTLSVLSLVTVLTVLSFDWTIFYQPDSNSHCTLCTLHSTLWSSCLIIYCTSKI